LSASASPPALERRLGFGSATTINVLAMGIGAYMWRAKQATEWPFEAATSG
jgi:hypothetical protein